MSIATKPVSADELLAMGDIGRCELVRGEIVYMAPAGHEHGKYGMALSWRVAAFVEQNALGSCFMAETGFVIAINPDTVRAPDLAFVPADRDVSPGRGFSRAVPALVVEVLLPEDSAAEIEVKVQDWLGFGVTSVWVVNPRSRSITIHRKGPNLVRFQENDTLVDEAVLPGFQLFIRDIFR